MSIKVTCKLVERLMTSSWHRAVQPRVSLRSTSFLHHHFNYVLPATLEFLDFAVSSMGG